MKLRRGGKALLRKALAAIKKHPETFDMKLWMRHDETVQGREPYCGTVACFAGHIVLAAGAKARNGYMYPASELRGPLRDAALATAERTGEAGVASVPNLALELVCADEAARDRMYRIFGDIDIKTARGLERRLKPFFAS